ncbi:MAG: exodeoxyribonuclease VII large subunit [Rubrivivax sp.]
MDSRGSGLAPLPTQGVVWGVSALLLAAGDTLASRFGALTVSAELSGLSRPASGHLYFTLKDADGAAASLRCAMFRRSAGLLDFAPAEGQRVQARGRLSIFEPRGDLQFIVESLQRQGAGSLYEEFLRLRARLERLGLFDPARRRPVSAHPRCLGVVTSLGAAALRDVLTTLARRAPHVRVVVFPTLVQGAEAPPGIVEALGVAGRTPGIDTVLLVRGGGSLEDLWAFNDERVVRAVAACAVPVICGVGHETDVTLCDLAADLRAPTPTAAAELAAPDRASLLQGLSVSARRLALAAHRVLDRHAQTLDVLARRAGAPAARLLAHAHHLDAWARRLEAALRDRQRLPAQALVTLSARLGRATRQDLEQRRERLDVLAARLQAVHPSQVLQRGYAWLQDPQGRPLMRAADLRAGAEALAVLHDGRAQVRVESVLPHTANPMSAPQG